MSDTTTVETLTSTHVTFEDIDGRLVFFVRVDGNTEATAGTLPTAKGKAVELNNLLGRPSIIGWEPQFSNALDEATDNPSSWKALVV